MKYKTFLAVLFSSFLLVACSGVKDRPDGAADVDDRTLDGSAVGLDGSGVETGGARLDGSFDISSLSDPESPLARRVIYFAFDSSEVTEEGQELIAMHSRFLAEHPQLTVVLEGHADERGSREYNLGLGERRAKSVERLMSLQGVAGNQMQVISFGEERPVAFGHDESAWQLNRRVELLYSGY